MRILGERHSFQADHSSTSYLFYSPEPLSEASRKLAHRFSSRACVGKHSVSYIWHGDYDGLSGGQDDQLLRDAFDIMISESYDWWTLAFCVPYTDDTMKLLDPFKEVLGEDDMGVRIERLGKKQKIRITIYARMHEDGPWIDEMAEYDAEYYDEDEEADKPHSFRVFVPHLEALRKEIMRGKTLSLQVIAAQFDPENWNALARAPKAAQWIVKCIDTN